MIKSDHLTKRYRKKVAVNDLTFEVETGKVTGFLGPNGAGKSTTMRLMLGLDGGEGTTTFNGRPLSSYPNPSEIVGILLEAKAFHPTRSARNHLRVLAAAGGVTSARVDEVLELVGLSDVAKKKPGKFSLGMSQRLGIAAALLGNPKYLVLDEPANGLDPEGIAWLREFIKDYADQGNGVLISSHLLSEMGLMADNVIVIGKGKLITSTSIEGLISSNGGSHTFVRAANDAKLKAVLAKAGKSFQRRNGGYVISGVKTDDIGQALFKAGVAVLELSEHNVSLEDAFLQLTSGAEEYHSATTEKKK